MALDRTWYNSLVDDDGSNTVGSVWDKADVDALMDAVDAEIARIQPGANFWTPTIQASGGGTPVYAAQTAIYAQSGKIVTVGGYVSVSSKGSLSGSLYLSLPFAGAAVSNHGAIVMPYFAGLAVAVASLGGYLTTSASRANLTYTAAAGGVNISFLDAAHIGAGFSFAFGGSYVSL